ncbi:ferric reductase-like transmembrane domain-containing protein [Modestobacter sp. Leaf380]|uniref:ferric reductase-like transmembrane domain-containing protein n=1 Tax=Modestobacter sp. Leaf380 TaxID=1736356 RepID=UPI0006FC4ACA|nr:ferric reductase-like transmembrane domain-containing protein [Modestobacter sp. Leaf380]KQS73679.1 hypothetical protein ASG41_03485 [Modestobacter sp. Leaf380]
MVDAPLRRLNRLAGVAHALLVTLAAVGLALALPARPGEGGAAHQLLLGSGIAALVWSYAGLVLGLVAGSRRPAVPGRRTTLVAVHRQLSLAVLALTLVHAVASVVGLRGGSWLVSFVPQTAEVGRLGWSAGILAFYLAVLLGPSWYLRSRVPRRAWLLAHQAAALTYVLGLFHALALGGDLRAEGWVRTAVWVAQLPLFALFAVRLLAPHRRVESPLARQTTPRQRALRDAAVLGVLTASLALLLVVLLAVQPGLAG